uniref:Uncharacterized protein n=1 Tax=Rhizophora mucronata TaxID=61149 RepID=A0A2P2Q1C0_RHIMU
MSEHFLGKGSPRSFCLPIKLLSLNVEN